MLTGKILHFDLVYFLYIYFNLVCDACVHILSDSRKVTKVRVVLFPSNQIILKTTTYCSLPYPSGTRPTDTHTTTRATTYPITHRNPLLSTSLFLELICDRLFTQMKSSTASMNIHTKPERKRKCRRPEITAHNTWRP